MPSPDELLRCLIVSLIASFLLATAAVMHPAIGFMPSVCVAIMVMTAYAFLRGIDVLDLCALWLWAHIPKPATADCSPPDMPEPRMPRGKKATKHSDEYSLAA